MYLLCVVLGNDTADAEGDWLCDVTLGAIGTYNQR